jgi:hypothetical protein
LTRIPIFRTLLSYLLAPLAMFAALGDSLTSAVLNILDFLIPLPDVAFAGDVPLRTTREVTYLRTGVHRLAQKALCLTDDDDDDDDGEGLDNGLAGRPRLNC